MSILDVDSDLDAALTRLDGDVRPRRVHAVASCASTQTLALGLDVDDAPHLTLVWARAQTAGRGRGGRSWVSHDDALQFSVVVRPRMPLAQLPRLTLLTGAALLTALRSLGVDALLKWPNDVVIDVGEDVDDAPLGPFRKVAGILTDVATKGTQLERAVIGVGLNAGHVDDDLSAIGVGLADLNSAPARVDVIAAVWTQLQRWLQDPANDAIFEDALDVQRQHSLTLGREVHVPDDDLIGVAFDLDVDGAVKVRDAEGLVHRVVAGDVWPAQPHARYHVDAPKESAS